MIASKPTRECLNYLLEYFFLSYLGRGGSSQNFMVTGEPLVIPRPKPCDRLIDARTLVKYLFINPTCKTLASNKTIVRLYFKLVVRINC
jgi:hypothetical protein